MKERPILFSGAMVRALLDGRKTQTRRVVKPSRRYPFEFVGGGNKDGPDWNDPACWGFMSEDGDAWLLKDGTKESRVHQIPCPYGEPGDRLWVRETFGEFIDRETINRRYVELGRDWVYRADQGARISTKWTPSIHMPRTASRILLEITDVRVERLNDISAGDARAEGITDGGCNSCGNNEPCGCSNPMPEARESFAHLWQSINGPSSWDANPWVWVVEFKRIQKESA